MIGSEPIRVLIGCESSGVVRDAFRALGADAWSCDLLEAEAGTDPTWHIVGDVLKAISAGHPATGERWQLLIAHPPCTYLASSGLQWRTRDPSRDAKMVEALRFARELLMSRVPCVCLENPVGKMSTLRPASQFVQPYHFGDDASKTTGLWLKNLSPLRIPPESQWSEPRILAGEGDREIRRWANQCDGSGASNVPGGPNQWRIRSRTYPGIAKAMATQWMARLESGYVRGL